MITARHRIRFTATTEIRMPFDDLGLIMMRGGQHPDAPSEEMLPSTVRDAVELADGSVVRGISEPSPLWFIETPDLKILIDSGLRSTHVDHANRIFRERGDRQFYIALDDDPATFLNRCGTTPDDIDVVILTHLHLDHFPNIAEFTNARVLAHAEELLVALFPDAGERYHWPEFRPYLFDAIPRIEVVRGDMEVCPGVQIWHGGGHSPGQLLVAVETALGTTLLASDFFNTYRNIEHSWPPGICTNLDEWETNARRFKLAADVIVPGHDWAVWDQFPNGVIG